MADYPDFEGGKSKLFTVADWAAIEATDKSFHGGEGAADNLATYVLSYAVPAVKTLYITWFAIVAYTLVVANQEKPQICAGYIQDFTTLVVKARLGGNGGAALPLNKPVVIDGGHTVYFAVLNVTGHAADIFVAAGGYEL